MFHLALSCCRNTTVFDGFQFQRTSICFLRKLNIFQPSSLLKLAFEANAFWIYIFTSVKVQIR
jgi:hypothetical protein